MQSQDQILSLLNSSTATPIVASKKAVEKRVDAAGRLWSLHRVTIFNAVTRCTGGCLFLIMGPTVCCCLADSRKKISAFTQHWSM